MQQTLCIVLALAAVVNCHYTFSGVNLNGAKQGNDWQYIREHTNGYTPTWGDNIAGDTFRCQPGGESGANTDVLSVTGGDKLMMTGAFGMNAIQHPGPAQVFMSKAPGDDVKSYDGSGDWFKVRDSTLCSDPSTITTDAWCVWNQPGIEFTIPSRLPDGEYLVRGQHIALHESQGTGKGAQFFFSCAQVKVQGNTGNTWLPSRIVKIPGMITEDDPGISFNIWNPSGITEYPYTPGGPLIIGGETWGSPSGSGGSVVPNSVKRAIAWSGSVVARAGALAGY